MFKTLRARVPNSLLFALLVAYLFTVASVYGYALGLSSVNPQTDNDFFVLSGFAVVSAGPALYIQIRLSRSATRPIERRTS